MFNIYFDAHMSVLIADTNSSEDDGDFPVFDHYYWYSSSYVDAIEAFKVGFC